MKLLNTSGSKHEFSDVCKKTGKMTVYSCLAGAELEFDEKHPLHAQLSVLPEKYPKDWKEVVEKKKSKAELQAELKAIEEKEKAEKAAADKAAKEKADADKKGAGDKDKATA